MLLCARRILVVLILATAASTAIGADTFPMRIPASGGEVVLPDDRAKRAHDQYHYAAARRINNTLYVSGVIVYRREQEGRDVPAFKLQVRRAFERLQAILAAADAGFQDVAMINSFHVWQGPNFTGTRDEQFAAFSEVASEFIKAPYPAWTAVGTTGLLGDNGIVEVQLIAQVPEPQRK